MELSLDSKHAIVCGSTSGIGKAIAERFADSGAKVTLIARDEEKLSNTVKELPANNDQDHDFIVADFSNPTQLREGIETYIQNNDPQISILVNNTGGPPAGPILEADPEEFLKAYEMHLICNQILVKNLVPIMEQQEYGRIINIISTSVRQPIDNLGVSNTTRGAVANWAKTLANEIGDKNITVNNILPGYVKTNRLLSILSNKATKAGVSEDEMKVQMENNVPLGRFAKPVEIANAALFLASSLSSYVSGSNLVVDGGRTKCY